MGRTASKSTDNAATKEEPIALDEYCRRLSVTDGRVELIGGFEADERISGHLKSDVSGFDAAFARFVARPA